MRSMLARSLPCFLLAASASLATAACGGGGSGTADPIGTVVASPLARELHPAVPSSDSSKLVADNTTFAFDLYHVVAADSTVPNLFYSPYSISIALSMAYNGAAGATAKQMAAALDFSQPTATLDTAFDKLDLALNSLGQDVRSTTGHPFHLNVADSTWGDKTFTFVPSFLDALAVDYGSNVHVVDFVNDPNASRLAINSWVSTETLGKIPNLLPSSAVTPDTRMVLVNAIYFDAAWATLFDPSQTADQAFTRLDGSKVTAPLMNGSIDTGYASTSSYQAVELPYDGNQTSMIVVVPNEGQFTTVESGLSEAFFQSVTSSLSFSNVSLGMPKFTIQGATISLKKELGKLGMIDAFEPSANFSALAKEPIYISDVLHQAFVSVDEKGTQAAAATAVVGVGLAVASDPVTLTVNRPFVFFIRDVTSNTVLFAGKVTDPTQ